MNRVEGQMQIVEPEEVKFPSYEEIIKQINIAMESGNDDKVKELFEFFAAKNRAWIHATEVTPEYDLDENLEQVKKTQLLQNETRLANAITRISLNYEICWPPFSYEDVASTVFKQKKISNDQLQNLKAAFQNHKVMNLWKPEYTVYCKTLIYSLVQRLKDFELIITDCLTPFKEELFDTVSNNYTKLVKENILETFFNEDMLLKVRWPTKAAYSNPENYEGTNHHFEWEIGDELEDTPPQFEWQILEYLEEFLDEAIAEDKLHNILLEKFGSLIPRYRTMIDEFEYYRYDFKLDEYNGWYTLDCELTQHTLVESPSIQYNKTGEGSINRCYPTQSTGRIHYCVRKDGRKNNGL